MRRPEATGVGVYRVVTAGGVQEPLVTLGRGPYARTWSENSPAGAGSQFARSEGSVGGVAYVDGERGVRVGREPLVLSSHRVASDFIRREEVELIVALIRPVPHTGRYEVLGG